MTHHCHAVACTRSVPPKLFMCARHWRMVPRKQQLTVWRVYRPGQEIDKQPSAEYLAVTMLVKADLAMSEIGKCKCAGELLRYADCILRQSHIVATVAWCDRHRSEKP